VCTHNIFRLAAALIGVGLALLRNAGQRLAGYGVIIRTGRVHLDGCRFCRLICSFRHCIPTDRDGKKEFRRHEERPGMRTNIEKV